MHINSALINVKCQRSCDGGERSPLPNLCKRTFQKLLLNHKADGFQPCWIWSKVTHYRRFIFFKHWWVIESDDIIVINHHVPIVWIWHLPLHALSTCLSSLMFKHVWFNGTLNNPKIWWNFIRSHNMNIKYTTYPQNQELTAMSQRSKWEDVGNWRDGGVLSIGCQLTVIIC